ncbi:MAG: VWA domain-containing protein [Spirochaetes bacterium]|nr:VWA domain-containing protein [Spirochaetota bacterium]
MLKMEGIRGVRTIHWENLRPGMILIGGFTVNDTIPYELRHFPVLTKELLNLLDSKYLFLKTRTFSVAETDPGYDSKEISDHINSGIAVFRKLGEFTVSYHEEKAAALRELGLDADPAIPVISGDHVEREHLVLDRYNSFAAPVKDIRLENLPADIPTFIDPALELKMTLGELVTGRVAKKLNLPDDREVTLHLVVDYSYSMNQMDKLNIVLSALHSFYGFISEFLLNTKILLYVFSDTCALVKYPLSGREIPRKDTNYASFMKKVLHHRDPERYNKVILFSDGRPSDLSEALLNGERMKKQGIDYTQILFSIDDDMRFYVVGERIEIVDGFAVSGDIHAEAALGDEEMDRMREGLFHDYSRVATACGGNQVVVKIHRLARFVAVECYDRYLGMLTLATREETERVRDGTYDPNGQPGGGPRKWEFKKL